jgi:hypothetical protein
MEGSGGKIEPRCFGCTKICSLILQVAELNPKKLNSVWHSIEMDEWRNSGGCGVAVVGNATIHLASQFISLWKVDRRSNKKWAAN